LWECSDSQKVGLEAAILYHLAYNSGP